jgi:hypothetical protein
MDPKFVNATSKRLARLEAAVFGPKTVRTPTAARDAGSGPTAGLRMLIAQGFFKSKQNLAGTRAALEKHDYHYSVQAVDMALKRLSRRDGPLVALKEAGKKAYAKRK